MIDVDGRSRFGQLVDRWQTLGTRSQLADALISFAVSFIPLIILWQLVYQLRLWPHAVFPSPIDVGTAGVALLKNGELLKNIAISLKNLAIGFTLGAVLGLPLGIAMGMNRILSRLVDPVVNLLQAIPGLAWIPLAILWFGLNQGAVTFIIFMSAFFPILFSTLTGVRATDRVLIDASETLGATHRDIVRHVILPSTLPFVMTGVRLGFGYGFRALVAGEMIAGSAGLGYMIFNAQDYLRSDIVVLGMLVIGTLWLLIDRIVLKPIERRTVERWGTLAVS